MKRCRVLLDCFALEVDIVPPYPSQVHHAQPERRPWEGREGEFTYTRILQGAVTRGRGVHECFAEFIQVLWSNKIYSRSPAEPASEGVLLPPTGMEVSTAIISARMSRTG